MVHPCVRRREGERAEGSVPGPVHQDAVNPPASLAGQDESARTAAVATPEERIRDIFVTVQKALKQRRLYDANSKTYQTTIELLDRKFAAFLAEFHALIVTVTADALVTEKEMHLAGQKREASIPFKLFRDGIRSIRFDANEGFFLNGKHVKLKGTNNHQDHAGVGVAVPDSIHEFRIRRLKEMGCNAYRCDSPEAALTN